MILSWSGVKTDKGTAILGAGILDWFTAIPAGMFDAVWIIIFLLVLGGFINVVIKSQAMEAVIGKIAKYFHTDFKKTPLALKQNSPARYYGQLIKEGIRQTWIIIPLMLFFSFAGTSYGMAEESLAFYAIIIPLALVAGFDVYTGFLIIFVGAGVGVMGSTINPFSIVAAVDASNGAVAASDGAGWRWISWVVFTLATIIFVMVYAARVKINKNNSALKDLFEVHAKVFAIAKVGDAAPALTKRRLATVIIFILSFVVMVFSMMAWDHMQGKEFEYNGRTTEVEYVTFANNETSSWFHNSETTQRMFRYASYDKFQKPADTLYELDDSLGAVKGAVKPVEEGGTHQLYEKGAGFSNRQWVGDWTFGYFYLGSLSAYFFIISLIIAAINWKSEKAYVEEMVVGAKDMLGVIFAVGIARGISVLLKSTNMDELFAEKLSNGLKGIDSSKGVFVPLLSYILFIPLTFIIPSTSGLANATFPVVGPALVDGGATNVLSGTITAYAWGAGLANMVVPTYGVVIGALAVTKIPFDKFLRAIWKYLLLMFLVGMVMVVIGGLTVDNDGVTQGIF